MKLVVIDTELNNMKYNKYFFLKFNEKRNNFNFSSFLSLKKYTT